MTQWIVASCWLNMAQHLRSPTPVWAWEVTGAWKKAADSFSVPWVLENCHEKDGYESTDQYFFVGLFTVDFALLDLNAKGIERVKKG